VLLIFGAAVAVQNNSGIDSGVALRLGLAVPGGIALGIAMAWAFRFVIPYTRGSLGGNLLEFVNTFLAWIVAERLGFSAVLCVVAVGMFVANTPSVQVDARNRVQSFAIWSAAVFLLNVLAFLLMGMQVRAIVGGMTPDRLRDSLGFAGLVVLGVIGTRLAWVLLYNRLATRIVWLRGGHAMRAPRLSQGIVVGWCGMRGLVTLATAFALPANFPQRDLIVLSAFAVVLATLVVQGLTLSPLIRLLGLADGHAGERELDKGRRKLADAALAAIADETGRVAQEIRRQFEIDLAAQGDSPDCADYDERQRLKLSAIAAQRDRLYALRDEDAIGAETFEQLQEELDWRELSIGPAGRRTIVEG